MADTWLIRGGRVIDPAAGRDEVADLYIKDGKIAPLPLEGADPDATEIPAHGLTVAPGFIDLHVHFREPGNDEAETIASGSRAAARGGFATVVTMPNTHPATDSPELVAATIEQAKACGCARVLPAACVSRGRCGGELADMRALAVAGAAAFTDDGSTVADDRLMREAMCVAYKLGKPVMDHALDRVLAGNGVMHEGPVSERLGLPGIPSAAEDRIVERNIRLAAETGCAMHIQHVSSGAAAEMIRRARDEGLPVSGEVTPHHLALSDEDVDPQNPDFKMNPPLRSESDRLALIEAVVQGSIPALATDHAPHRRKDKDKGFLNAPFGIVGLETAIGVTYSLLVQSGRMCVADWIRRWTEGPARVLALPPPSLAQGSVADISILDLETEWTIDAKAFASRSCNTPFQGRAVVGRAVATFCGGTLTWRESL